MAKTDTSTKPTRPGEAQLIPGRIRCQLRCPACNGPVQLIEDETGAELWCDRCTRFDVTDGDYED